MRKTSATRLARAQKSFVTSSPSHCSLLAGELMSSDDCDDEHHHPNGDVEPTNIHASPCDGGDEVKGETCNEKREAENDEPLSEHLFLFLVVRLDCRVHRYRTAGKRKALGIILRFIRTAQN